MNHLRALKNLIKRFYKGYKLGQLRRYFTLFFLLLDKHSRKFLADFYFDTEYLSSFNEEHIPYHKRTVKGLHSLMGKNHFSVLIEGENERTYKSALEQASPLFEVVNENPQGDYILFLPGGDTIRFDFLYRVEQFLNILKEENAVIYCPAVLLDDYSDTPLPGMKREPALELPFPYLFEAPYLTGLVIPKKFYREVKDLDPYARVLKLDALGAKFYPLEAPLYGKRFEPQKPQLESLFNQYYAWKGLDWKVEPGLTCNSIRAIPPLKASSVQIIIPYKDQKELTLKAVDAALKQEGIKVEITCVDNRSADTSIADILRTKGVDVLSVDEPFNYSRLNNLGSKRSKSELILFLNNDAILHPGAIAEMARWAHLPEIGMVGCLLFYPNGLVQHGGVRLAQKGGYEETMNWVHNDHKKPYDLSHLAKTIHITDAVTAASAMMRRDVFEKVGGFDDESFPIAYSDTRLACKILKEKLFSLYTPFASGIHHESLTRKGNAIEDFDRSIFWHNRVNDA